MKVVIAGSRTIRDYSLIVKAVSRAKLPITELISGGATGVDRLGERWATVNDVPITLMKAEWDKYGKRAGMLRNEKMANYTEAAIILWDGESRGTKNMIDNMKKLDKPYYLMMAKKTLEDFI